MRVIIGEAPSAQGDGTPFTGPSGARLCDLLGVPDLPELKKYFDLDNIFHHLDPRWDQFDRRLARQVAGGKLDEYLTMSEPVTVIMCGKRVWNAFRGKQQDWFEADVRNNTTLWTFPHPSGLSHFWNSPVNRERASVFLRLRADIAEGDSAHRAVPLAHGSSEVP